MTGTTAYPTTFCGRITKFAFFASAVLLLGACSSNDDDAGVSSASAVCDPAALAGSVTRTVAFVAASAGDYSSGQTKRFSLDGGIAEDGALVATGSDIRVVTDGCEVFELGRRLLDSVTKYDPANIEQPVFQYSVAGDDTTANPYSIAFLNRSKAYLIRYDSPKVWIVNPSATSADTFKIGELDLSAYDQVDNIPEANGAVIVGDRLYILMERLDRFANPPGYTVNTEGYLAVFDTQSDNEIDTRLSTDADTTGLMGIQLGVRNPTGLQLSEADGLLYVFGRGDNFSLASEGYDRYTGGVVSIDPANYVTDLVLDDGTEADNVGFINDLLAVSSDRAYVVTSAGYASNTLRALNPITGMLEEGDVANLEALDITTLAQDGQNRLWVGLNGENPGFKLLNASDGADLDTFVPTQLVPINVVFVTSLETVADAR